jgi:UDP-glucuronate 4-epimerase
MKILVTGSAGFIGFHTAKKFVDLGHNVIGIDNINDYYAVSLKYDRLENAGISHSEIHYNTLTQSFSYPNYQFMKMDLEDAAGIMMLFKDNNFDLVIHLAAQAGVRYSLENPKSYIQSNVVGFLNILEACRYGGVKKLVYASSSSIYGLSEKQQLSVMDRVDNPISLYAATKKANELMAHVYSHLYDFTTVGLRFFTVYGPWGRPDMAPFLFADAISKGKPIQVFNKGNMQRDFTYIDDIVEGIVKVFETSFEEKYNIFNIGNSSPIKLLNFIECLEKALNKKAEMIMREMQPGDVIATWADIKDLVDQTGYRPKVSINEGVEYFVEWFRSYYKVT